MIKVNATNNINNANDNIMPMPLETAIKNVKNFYDESKDKAYMQFLESNIYKLLKPYVLKSLEDEKYVGSPIYNGYIDKDTIGSIVDKVIYYAEQENPDINEIVSNIEVSEYSKIMLLRAVIQSMVLNELFYEIRPENKDNINFDYDIPNDSSDIEQNIITSLINFDDVLPMMKSL